MDRITKAINLLGAVTATMDQISIIGVENQSKFVGCAEAVQNVFQTLASYLAEAQTEQPEAEEEVNGR